MVVDGLGAFKGATNLTNSGLRRADRKLDISEVETDFAQVTYLNNKYVTPVCRRITSPEEQYLWSALPCRSAGQRKIVASLANTFSRIAGGTRSTLRPLREPISIARGWSQRITPVVRVPASVSETAKPAVRAKFSPACYR